MGNFIVGFLYLRFFLEWRGAIIWRITIRLKLLLFSNASMQTHSKFLAHIACNNIMEPSRV